MNLEDRFNKLKSKQELLIEDIQDNNLQIKKLTELSLDYQESIIILSEVSELTQSKFKSIVEKLITSGIQSIYTERPLKFELEFSRRGGKLECIPKIIDGVDRYKPEDEIGGGLLNVISFMFRVVLWSLKRIKTRPFFLLDEPMIFVGKGELLERTGEMLEEFSKELKFQLLIITHERQLCDIADRVFYVTHNGKKSKVIQS